MTELKQLYLENRAEAREKIQNMTTARIFAELYDTVTIDMLHLPAMDCMNNKDLGVFEALLYELRNRVK